MTYPQVVLRLHSLLKEILTDPKSGAEKKASKPGIYCHATWQESYQRPLMSRQKHLSANLNSLPIDIYGTIFALIRITI